MKSPDSGKFYSQSKEVSDLGLSSKVTDRQRIINKNGSFNIDRKGLPFWESFSVYHWLISMSWIKFCLIILVAYLVTNIFFAGLYYIGGEENFTGIVANNEFERFLNEFFFSTQTFTTVGYGRVSPAGIYSNIISSVESLAGLLSLAIATGLLYGRFSRPLARILYSEKAVIAPFMGGNAFQFRIANKRAGHHMVDVEVEVIMSKVEEGKRSFFDLELEYKEISFFTSTWTVNHPINEVSPLSGMSEEDFRKNEIEFLVLLKGFDDTFAQTVHSRNSYTHDEIIWGARFANVYELNDDGITVIRLDKVSDVQMLP